MNCVLYICNIQRKKDMTNTNTNTETVIVKSNGNESIAANLTFRILRNGKSYDMFIHETYSEAKSRLQTLKRIGKHSNFEILVLE